MESSSQDKNLPATDRHLQQARADGQLARSKDLTHLAVLGGGLALLVTWAPIGMARMLDALKTQLRFDHDRLQQGNLLMHGLVEAVGSGLALYMPLALAVGALAVAATVGVGGWVVTFKPLSPNLDSLNPISGFGRLFSKQQVVDVLKMAALSAVIGTVGWFYLSAHLTDFMSLLLQPLDTGLVQMGRWLANGMALLLLVVAAMAAIDVPLAVFMHKQRLRMSHQEVKQEHKEVDGNPQLKGRMRARARELAQRNSIAAVPKADLVVMNPTHYAVAIQYDEGTMRAPRVIAKGADLLAMRIREVATGCKVPVLQSPMLARALYAHAEIDEEIPLALYTAVAQVLAYVYQVKAALNGKGPMPAAEPVPDVPVELDPHHKAQAKAAR